MKTVAIIPAYNESHHLFDIARRAAKYVDEVIIVDDGSGLPIASRLPNVRGTIILRHAINLGKGAALKTGVEYAQRRGAVFAVFIDADGQHVPEEIPALLKPLLENQAELVLGVREFHRGMPMVAKLGNVFLTRSLAALFHIHVTDTQSGFRAMRLDVYPRIAWSSPRYAVEAEMLVNASKEHLRIYEVPISTIYNDKYRGTTVIDGVRIFLNMLLWRLL